MAVSRAGYILCLIGGILSIFGSLIILPLAIWFLSTGISLGDGPLLQFFPWLWVVGATLGIILGVLIIIASQWMKKEETAKKGSIVCLICGILGAGGIITIIGGILGLVKAGET
ncbi:TPA: hypothetical protein HA278_01835 [Candidatus Woesearchaeota archaeon]|nr:hypothetical protein [archaeon]HIJ10775.1 hypothetical protein [Candidatus Woesearchaeota archaeon]|tara:strand:+ start:60 stop:401 length:342 start_codon:yes stop_codon:yes gene_type:complete